MWVCQYKWLRLLEPGLLRCHGNGRQESWGSKGSRWVLQWINTKRGNGGYSDSLAHDMSVWINLLEEFRCSYIMREGRMAADFIAGVGSKGTVVQYAQDTNRYV